MGEMVTTGSARGIQEGRDILRFITAGSVDDGKSTLIGRLLYDTKTIFEDQLEHVEDVSRRRGDERTNLALLTDGLRAEREQGITIDVAYRYFSTPRRKFIIADAPGHIQYTRNMVTGASTANLAIVLVDARKGLVEQSRRHTFIASLLGIPHIVFAVNKMDLVDYSEEVFDRIKAEFTNWAAKLQVRDLTFIPISALHGDNIVERSGNMPWYRGTPLLYHLETVHIASDRNLIDVRFPVQWVIRPQSDEHHDFRGYAGTVAGGILKPGDDVVVLPSGFTSKIAQISTYDGPVDEAFPPMAVTVQLADDLDVSRGDMICRPNNRPTVTQDLDAMVCWMTDRPLKERGRYALKHTSRWVRAMVTELQYRLDVNSLHREEAPAQLGLNDIGRVKLRTTAPIFFDPYQRNRTTGSFILVDETTNETVGAGMLV
jgi:sulfate adenylyltransferase large subunit